MSKWEQYLLGVSRGEKPLWFNGNSPTPHSIWHCKHLLNRYKNTEMLYWKEIIVNWLLIINDRGRSPAPNGGLMCPLRLVGYTKPFGLDFGWLSLSLLAILYSGSYISVLTCYPVTSAFCTSLEIFSAEFRDNFPERLHRVTVALACSIAISGILLQMDLSWKVIQVPERFPSSSSS